MKLQNLQVISDGKGKIIFNDVEDSTSVDEFKNKLKNEFKWQNVDGLRLTLEQRELTSGSLAENGVSHNEKYLYVSPMQPGGS
jgi:hypothetical protein